MEILIFLIQLIVSSLIIYWGCRVAEDNGRNIPVAAVLCYIFGIFAIIGYYIAGTADVVKKKDTDEV